MSERTGRDYNRPYRNGEGRPAGGDGNDDAATVDSSGGGGGGGGDDIDMDQSSTRGEQDSLLCKFNQRCTNPACSFAHASPAAPYGATVDVTDQCSFGVACKNWKCTGRHPSPAAKLAHQSEQDCKFFPNCQNRNCPFKHPAAPPCRNGGECMVAGCTFTHLKVKCKFTPCMNASCPFMHEEGQRGAFKDKVWSADDAESKTTASAAAKSGPAHGNPMDRRFVDGDAKEELVLPGSGNGSHDPDGLQVTS